jgi:biopolymer transport protein TolQ
MNVTADLDIWTLILGASLVVKAVMLLLLAVSFLSWMFIFSKWFAIRRARAQTEQFEREFWGGSDLHLLYQGAVNNRHTIGSQERIFESGFREFTKLRNQRSTTARAAPCAPPTSARWTTSSATWRSSLPPAR